MSRILPPHLRLACASLALAGSSLLACRTPSSKVPIEELTKDEQAQAEGQQSEALEPLAVEHPADMLPPEVAVLSEAIDPTALLELVGPLDKYEQLDRGRQELRDALGGDVIDPSQWAALGLDASGPAGAGVLDVDSEAFAFYVSLSDEPSFEQVLARLWDRSHPNQRLPRREIGGARIYRFDDELNVVVRERVAMIVFVDHPDRAPRDYAVTAATIDPRESLGRGERFEWARTQVQEGDDGMLFIVPNNLLAQIEREHGRDSRYGVLQIEEELARARSGGDSPERIRELEHRLEAERRWQRERDARREAERELVRAFIGPIEVMAGAADLRSDAITAHGRVRMPGEGLLRRLLVAPEHESPLLRSLAEPPVFAIEGRADMQAFVELLELFAKAEGGSLTELNATLAREFGIDLLGGLFPALSGEGGFVVTQVGEPDPRRLGEVRRSFGLASYLGLRDPEAIRKLLDNVARTKQLGGILVRARRGDGWLLKVPNWHEVMLEIVGERLVIASDAKLSKRIAAAEAGAQAEALATASHPFRGPMANPALRLYGRWTGLMALDAQEPWEQDAEGMLHDINTHHELSPDEAAKVKRSREYKRKLAELEEAVEELNEHNRRRAAARFEKNLAFATKLGDVGLQVEPAADGFSVAAQWRFASGTTPLELGFQLFAIAADDHDWAEQERLLNRTYELANELRQIRQADLDAAAAKRRKSN